MGGTTAKEEQNNRDKNCVLLRDKREIRDRWGKLFPILLNTKSPKLDPTMVEQFPVVRPVELSLVGALPIIEMKEAIQSMGKEKAAGSDSPPVELLKLDNSNTLRHFHSIIVAAWWKGDV